MFKNIIFIFVFFFSTISHAWVISSNVTIKELVQWEGAGNALIVLSNDKKCYVSLADKELYSFVLAMYMSGKSLTTYCYDEAEIINGYTESHKLHRLNGT